MRDALNSRQLPQTLKRKINMHVTEDDTIAKKPQIVHFFIHFRIGLCKAHRFDTSIAQYLATKFPNHFIGHELRIPFVETIQFGRNHKAKFRYERIAMTFL